jgi:hypothetical protein
VKKDDRDNLYGWLMRFIFFSLFLQVIQDLVVVVAAAVVVACMPAKLNYWG